MDYDKLALELHKFHKGKIETGLKIPLENKQDLSAAYTPGVAKVSELIAEDPELAYLYTIKQNTIAVITDGSAVLGLGNIGPLGALPVMEGKSALFKKFADVDAFPICLDTQDTEAIINTIKYLAPGFGGINLEDISAPRCFEIEERLKAELSIPIMHDDQHGTAVVVLAALINSLKLVNKDKQKVRIVINGAGAAGMAIAKLLKHYGFLHIIACDSVGIIHSGRQNLTLEKQAMLEFTNSDNLKGLLNDAIKEADVFIGVSKANLLTPQDIQTMAEKSIVFAMANPVPEILMEDAKSGGAYIYASGRSDTPNQINNVLAFPGLFRGALDNRIKSFTTEHFIRASENIAGLVTSPSVDCIIPSPFTPGLAEAVAKSFRLS